MTKHESLFSSATDDEMETLLGLLLWATRDSGIFWKVENWNRDFEEVQKFLDQGNYFDEVVKIEPKDGEIHIELTDKFSQFIRDERSNQ
jgi:hypothetical protein